MTDLCKHKGAAASINWFVGLVAGKRGADQRETIKVLAEMLHDMQEKNCKTCSVKKDCHDLDKAARALAESDRAQTFVPEPSIVGPLTMRREHAMKRRLIRPVGR